jgi:hypothetical protein
MANNYSVRYITADQFVRYCADLNVETDNRELEHYEKAGIMLPVARLVYPEEYIRLNTLWFLGMINELPQQDKWPELARLFEKSRVILEQYADLQDDELIDSFDREIEKNPYLIRPTTETYKSWDSYDMLVTYQEGHQLTKSTVEHYYCSWQVHQLYHIQQFPDLYDNSILIDHISDEIKQLGFPRAPSQIALRELNGLAPMFDALSFWITMYNRERSRTFALVAEEHRVKHLDAQQHQAYQDRLTADSKLVMARYGITIDDFYKFLYELIELYNDYRKKERYKLSEELRNDIIYQAQLIEAISGSDWEAIAEELGKRYTFWTKQNFRHLDILTKERDEARDLLTPFAVKYTDALGEFNIPSPKFTFSATEIDELLDYCEHNGLSVLPTALSGMIATQEDFEEKFRRVSLYTNIKNALTALEYLLKIFAQNGGIVIDRSTLNPTIKNVMKNEAWISLFVEKSKKHLKEAKDSAEFFVKLNELVGDTDLVQSEDAYWARVFLIASLARNLTVHAYPTGDWFYGELFDEMLRAAIYAILYSWKVAKREGWT